MAIEKNEPFRYWVQMVLPTVYDDSLSYYELLCKVVKYLNQMGEGVNQIGDALNKLQHFVNSYFESLDVSAEVNKRLDEMITSGEFNAIISNVYGYITPEMYGAKGDGITNDSEAVKEALSKGGKILFTRDKTYAVMGELSVKSNTDIVIDGTILACDELGFSLLLHDGVTPVPGYTGVHDVTISGSGVFDCNGDTHPEFTRTAIRIYHCENICVKNITIKNYSKYHAIEIGGSKDVVIDGVKFKGMFKNNNVNGTYEAIQLEEINQVGSWPAVPYDKTVPKNISIVNCYFSKSDEGGEMYTAIGSHSALNVTDKDKFFEDITIAGNVFDIISKNNNTDNLSVSEKMFTIVMDGNWKNVRVFNNTFQTINKSGIFIGEYSNNIYIYNNVFNFVYGVVISTEENTEKVFIKNNNILEYAFHNTVTANNTTCSCMYLRGLTNFVVCNNYIKSTYSKLDIHLPGVEVNSTKTINISGNTINTIEFNDYEANRNNSVSNFKVLKSSLNQYNGTITFSESLGKFDVICVRFKANNNYFERFISHYSIGSAISVSQYIDGKMYQIVIDVKETSIAIKVNNRSDSWGSPVGAENASDFMVVDAIIGYKIWNNYLT